MLTTGADILHIPRLEEALAKHGMRFLQRVYTPQELTYCRGRVPELAARFAAKEAISIAQREQELEGGAQCLGAVLAQQPPGRRGREH